MIDRLPVVKTILDPEYHVFICDCVFLGGGFSCKLSDVPNEVNNCITYTGTAHTVNGYLEIQRICTFRENARLNSTYSLKHLQIYGHN